MNIPIENPGVPAEAFVSEGERLRELVAACDAPQRSVAEAIGVTQTALSKWLTNSARIQEDELGKLIDFCRRRNPAWMHEAKEVEYRQMLLSRRLDVANPLWDKPQHFGDRVQALRIVAGKSLPEMGALFGINHTSWKSREKNKPLIEEDRLEVLIGEVKKAAPQWLEPREAMLRADYEIEKEKIPKPKTPDEIWDNANSVGQYMLAIRTCLGLSQRELGIAVGVTQTLVTQWESNEIFPGKDYLEKIYTLIQEHEIAKTWFTPEKRTTFDSALKKKRFLQADQMLEKATNANQRVRAVRTACGFTQDELAETLGMASSNFQSKEQDNDPHYFTIGEYQRVLESAEKIIPEWMTGERKQGLAKQFDNEQKAKLAKNADPVWNGAIKLTDLAIALREMAKAMRLATGMDQTAYCRGLGISPSHYNAIELGNKPARKWLYDKAVPYLKKLHPEWMTDEKVELISTALDFVRHDEELHTRQEHVAKANGAWGAAMSCENPQSAISGIAKALRHAAYLSQSELVGEVGWDSNYIERGVANASRQRILQLAELAKQRNPDWVTDDKRELIEIALLLAEEDRARKKLEKPVESAQKLPVRGWDELSSPGELLVFLRSCLRLGQAELAEQLGVPVELLKDWESDREIPSITQISDLSFIIRKQCPDSFDEEKSAEFDRRYAGFLYARADKMLLEAKCASDAVKALRYALQCTPEEMAEVLGLGAESYQILESENGFTKFHCQKTLDFAHEAIPDWIDGEREQRYNIITRLSRKTVFRPRAKPVAPVPSSIPDPALVFANDIQQLEDERLERQAAEENGHDARANTQLAVGLIADQVALQEDAIDQRRKEAEQAKRITEEEYALQQQLQAEKDEQQRLETERHRLVSEAARKQQEGILALQLQRFKSFEDERHKGALEEIDPKKLEKLPVAPARELRPEEVGELITTMVNFYENHWKSLGLHREGMLSYDLNRFGANLPTWTRVNGEEEVKFKKDPTNIPSVKLQALDMALNDIKSGEFATIWKEVKIRLQCEGLAEAMQLAKGGVGKPQGGPDPVEGSAAAPAVQILPQTASIITSTNGAVKVDAKPPRTWLTVEELAEKRRRDEKENKPKFDRNALIG